ncbi:ABC-three component system protein [Sphingobacterium siyangense]|uniref:ABC-three component system protein n=1 Tax=Sphingobacterium siyangense TaxID=459529 RepID=UPI002896ADAC|nr:ABC-three component system protein [Sphingobacterium siyangense]
MNKLPIFTVKVGSGSGCLFQPMSDQYSYVLTARHVIKDSPLPLSIVRQTVNEEGDLVNEELEMIGEPYYHNDFKNIDAAIIKIQKVDDSITELLRLDKPFAALGTFVLAGHPNSRSREDFSYRDNNLTLKIKKPLNYIEGELERVATHKEIVGQSGGGIINIDNGHYYLAGIQKKMSVPDGQETLGRIDFMPMAFFDEIVAVNDDLIELLPYYLTSFSLLKNQVMKIENCLVPGNVAYTRDFLRNITDKIVNNNLTPLFVKNFFNEKLLIGNKPSKNDLLSKELWITWLEYLIILNLVKDNDITEGTLEENFNSFRILFSNTTKDWSAQFKEITQSDFRGLSQNGCIIVSTKSKPDKYIIPSNAIDDIIRANNVQAVEMLIDEGVEHPFKSYKLIHLYAFQKKCIIEKEEDYRDYNSLSEQELIVKLKAEYEELLRH